MNRPTNVLAFPMLEEKYGTSVSLPVTGSDNAPPLLGDIVISMEKAQEEAETAGITLNERVSQLMIHGILHLVGYDHEKGEDQSRKMETKSLELIRFD